MLPIPGETYQEYLDRVSATDEIAYTIQELRDMGWEELADGKLWQPQLTGEPPPPSGEVESGVPEGPEAPFGAIPQSGPVTVIWWVWCYEPHSGQWTGPWTQLEDFDWSDGIAYIVATVDALSKAFCEGNLAATSPKAPLVGEMSDYDWAIQSPLGLQFNKGI